ncbi:hypothetical protein ANTQUA_LOCUS3705 [Anthophora quadrimaculata]
MLCCCTSECANIGVSCLMWEHLTQKFCSLQTVFATKPHCLEKTDKRKRKKANLRLEKEREMVEEKKVEEVAGTIGYDTALDGSIRIVRDSS